ncbi:hypothetical protein [Streptobacillus moniliformis]|uniref:hypothetical protein n=1 Tax=Streptobacillus moniliformis TaxID=34105 RepID=UPI0007E3D3AE|nr:hypothetical protein [Streptobacillus moniliformis]
MIKNKILGLMSISTVMFGGEYYIKNGNNVELGYEKAFNKKVLSEVNAGGIFGTKKEVFIFAGGEIGYSKVLSSKLHTGLNFKKRITDEIDLILNVSYKYNDNEKHEESIKDMLKLRGEWKKEYEKDKEALKEYYHSQGLRFKKEETLFSAVVGYDNERFRLDSGAIYTSGYLDNSSMRFESFVNLKTKKLNHNIDFYLSHKIRDASSQKGKYTKGGRLEGRIRANGKIKDIETTNSLQVYLGSIIPDKRDYKLTNENELKYNINNFDLLTALNNGLSFRQVEKNKGIENLKIRLQPELKLELKYANNRLGFESKSKLKGRVDIKNKVLDKDEYKKKDSVTVNNTDIQKVAGLVYSDNKLNYKLGIFDVRLSGRYVGVVNIKDDGKLEAYNQYAFVGPGLTYENKEMKHSIDIRYELGYKDKKTFSVINIYSDNRHDYKVNDRLSLRGELNFTSSNRFSFMDKESDKNEILLLADTKGTLEYKLNDKIGISTSLGAKTISLFKYKNNTQAVQSQASNASSNIGDESLHLITKYSYKVYSDNEVKYRANKNIEVIGKLNTSFSYGIKSDKLYESLTRIKRERIGENGIETHTEEDLKKIKDEEGKFGDNKAILIATPSIGLDMKYLNDKLLIKPSLGVDVSANIGKDKSELTYKETNVKANLNVEYRW